jgi:hypothetical protein
MLIASASCWRRLQTAPAEAVQSEVQQQATKAASCESVRWRTRITWISLAAVPSSLSLGCTQYLSTDVATFPLLWVLPLFLYLVSFVIAFSSKPCLEWWSKLAPFAAILVAIPIVTFSKTPVLPVVAIHLLALLILTTSCHGRLASLRPSASHLTEFYLWMAVGGLAGGLFNSLIAPLLFPAVVEYQIAIVAAVCLRFVSLRSKNESEAIEHAQAARNQFDLVCAAVAFAYMTIAVLVAVQSRDLGHRTFQLVFGVVPAAACLVMLIGFRVKGEATRRVSACLACMFAGGFTIMVFGGGTLLHIERTFFGVHRVITDKVGAYNTLLHGTTRHGVQAVYEGAPLMPTAYFHPTGPIGQVLQEDGLESRLRNVAVIGLGAGSVAAYNEQGCRMTFYEIDRAVVSIASNKDYFTFLQPENVRGEIHISIGDGRLNLTSAPDAGFGIILLDAFSSDAIPVHLLTREALTL